MDKFDLFDLEPIEEDSKYTTKVSIPQYLPKAECPSVHELVSTLKYDELVKEIRASNVSDEQKEFLINAATRHMVFNYGKIADYYAHQPREMQKLMEKSALVIIDLNDAIANGYVTMQNRIMDIARKQTSVQEALARGEKANG